MNFVKSALSSFAAFTKCSLRGIAALMFPALFEAVGNMAWNSKYAAAHPGVEFHYHLYRTFIFPSAGGHDSIVLFWHTWLALGLLLLTFASGFFACRLWLARSPQSRIG